MTTQDIMYRYDLTEEDIEPHVLVNTENGWRTAVKECAAIKRMNQSKVLSHFFGNCRYKWITDKALQKSGIDLIIDGSINIDLKSLIGNAYTITDEDNPLWDGKYDPCIVVEISQNGVFTNSKDKKTDYVLYYISDNIEEKFVLVDYAEIKRISGTELFTKKHIWHTSNNASGIYIKIPIKELKTAKIFELSHYIEYNLDNRRITNMKKILVLMILSLVGFTNAFGCTCLFDEIEELTCEVKYMICKGGGFDIEVCDNIKEKAKQFENDYSKVCEELSEVAKPLREIDEKVKHLEEDYKSKSNRDLPRLYLERDNLQRKYIEVSEASITVMDEFLGEEGNEIMNTESIVSELFQLVDSARKQ